MACRARFTRDPSSLPLAPRVLRPRQEATPYFAAKELAGFQHIGRHRVHVQSLELWERPRQTHQGDDGFAVRLDFEGALARLLLVDLDGCNTLQRRLDLGSTGFEGASGLAGLNGYDGLACFGGAFRGRGGLGRGLRLLSNRLLRCHSSRLGGFVFIPMVPVLAGRARIVPPRAILARRAKYRLCEASGSTGSYSDSATFCEDSAFLIACLLSPDCQFKCIQEQ